jgi:hypothetical protein
MYMTFGMLVVVNDHRAETSYRDYTEYARRRTEDSAAQSPSSTSIDVGRARCRLP